MSKISAYFGEFGGQYVPQILVPALDQLEAAFVEAQQDPAFQEEFLTLLKEYAGRPTALTLCQNLTKGTKTKHGVATALACAPKPERVPYAFDGRRSDPCSFRVSDTERCL
ncbi:hypothetical protein GCM10007086_32750 [Photobacterium aphoticum]|nr:hypothetical protein GCM10007086_32750 [Photobacterium aphoticum]